ncbi:hypothetical protein MMC13_000165 [Lambiella insularis]|nr:hypothetical protein [Lambiella insularis]
MHHNQPRVFSLLLDLGKAVCGACMLDAIRLNLTPILRLFLDHGWNINESLTRGTPPLLAYALFNEPLTRWFLAHGASPTARTKAHLAYTPLCFAAFGVPLSAFKLLYSHTPGLDDALQCAAHSDLDDRLELMQFLLEQGADINAVKWKHDKLTYRSNDLMALGTALHYAVRSGSSEKARFLLDWGARVDVRDSMGCTVVDDAWCEETRQEWFLEMLAERGVCNA